MKMKTIVAATLLGVSSFAANANIIDLFDAPVGGYQMVQDFTNGASPVYSQYGSSPTILGGYRDLIVDALTNAAPPVTGSTLLVQNGFLTFSNTASAGSGVNGLGIVQWDGDDSANIQGLNYTGLNSANLVHQTGCAAIGCDRFQAIVGYADQGFGYSIGVYTDATHYSILSANTLFPVGGSYLAEYLFSWFSLGVGPHFEGGLPFTITHGVDGMADFENVGAIEMQLNTDGTIAVDLTIDSVTKTVPEPGSMALAGLGLLGLAALRRRKQA